MAKIIPPPTWAVGGSVERIGEARDPLPRGLWDHGLMAQPHKTSEEPAHDVLAAEAFALPTRDPALEPAHDVLAAEGVAVPTRDPSLHQAPVVLPEDPSGIEGPHDVLAAEEFAMPAV